MTFQVSIDNSVLVAVRTQTQCCKARTDRLKFSSIVDLQLSSYATVHYGLRSKLHLRRFS